MHAHDEWRRLNQSILIKTTTKKASLFLVLQKKWRRKKVCRGLNEQTSPLTTAKGRLREAVQ